MSNFVYISDDSSHSESECPIDNGEDSEVALSKGVDKFFQLGAKYYV